MNEGMQIYKFNSMMLYQQDFYNMTRLNYMYNKRRIYINKKNELQYNSYFPFSVVKEKVNFGGLYLSAYAAADFFDLDLDFDIGFNNIENNIEKKIISLLKPEFEEIIVMIKIYNSFENRNIIESINEKYNIIHCFEGVNNIYIISVENIEDVNGLQEYLCGVFFGEKEYTISYAEMSFDLMDLKTIWELLEKFSLVLLRVPLFSNYNLVFYSKQERKLDILAKKILQIRNNLFDIQVIDDIRSPQNFLLIKEN